MKNYFMHTKYLLGGKVKETLVLYDIPIHTLSPLTDQSRKIILHTPLVKAHAYSNYQEL